MQDRLTVVNMAGESTGSEYWGGFSDLGQGTNRTTEKIMQLRASYLYLSSIEIRRKIK
jgi:hypothetical protein